LYDYEKAKTGSCNNYCQFLLMAFTAWKDDRPTLYIIGDSTVRNSMTNGQWGWGTLIAEFWIAVK